MRQYRTIDLTGVKGIKPCWGIYDMEGDRFICVGHSRSEMLSVTMVLNGDSPTASEVARMEAVSDDGGEYDDVRAYKYPPAPTKQ